MCRRINGWVAAQLLLNFSEEVLFRSGVVVHELQRFCRCCVFVGPLSRRARRRCHVLFVLRVPWSLSQNACQFCLPNLSAYACACSVRRAIRFFNFLFNFCLFHLLRRALLASQRWRRCVSTAGTTSFSCIVFVWRSAVSRTFFSQSSMFSMVVSTFSTSLNDFHFVTRPFQA